MGGVLNGCIHGADEHLTRWRWENIWLVYALAGQLIIPCAVLGTVIPHSPSLYAQVPTARLVLVLLLGTFWESAR